MPRRQTVPAKKADDIKKTGRQKKIVVRKREKVPVAIRKTQSVRRKKAAPEIINLNTDALRGIVKEEVVKKVHPIMSGAMQHRKAVLLFGVMFFAVLIAAIWMINIKMIITAGLEKKELESASIDNVKDEIAKGISDVNRSIRELKEVRKKIEILDNKLEATSTGSAIFNAKKYESPTSTGQVLLTEEDMTVEKLEEKLEEFEILLNSTASTTVTTSL